MGKLFSFFLFSETSNLLVALGLGYLAQRLLNQETSYFLLAFMACAAFFFYSLERNLTLPSFEASIFPRKTQWIAEHARLNRLLLLCSGVGSLVLFFFLRFFSQVFLFGFFLLALSYSLFPIMWHGRRLRLKEVPWLKPVLLTGCWVALTLWLPLIEGGEALGGKALLLTLIWFSWIFANSVFFDIRDLDLDSQAGNRTLAMTLGKERAHRLIQGTLFAQLFLVWLWLEHGHIAWLWALSLGTLAFLWLNHRFQLNRQPDLPFFLAADLTLALPGLMLILWF